MVHKNIVFVCVLCMMSNNIMPNNQSVIIVSSKDQDVLIYDSFDLDLGLTKLSAKNPAFVSNSNKMNLVGGKKGTKQKNVIHQDCQKIQSNSNTVKAALNNTWDTLSKAWHHITAESKRVCHLSLLTHTLHTPPQWAAFTWCHQSESLAIIFSSHFPGGFDFTKTTQRERARSVLLHGHNSYNLFFLKPPVHITKTRAGFKATWRTVACALHDYSSYGLNLLCLNGLCMAR